MGPNLGRSNSANDGNFERFPIHNALLNLMVILKDSHFTFTRVILKDSHYWVGVI